MNKEMVEEKVIELLSKLSDEEDIKPDSNLIEDLGISSMDVLFLIATVEEMFGISIPEKLIRTMFTVSDVVTVIQNQIA